MRTRKDLVLGVEFAPHQIRIVEIQGRASNAQVLHAGIAAMPEGAFAGDKIAEPEAVAIALRRLVESSKVVSRDVVFGLASGSVVTQVMNVPFVPDSELQTVLEGELEHYKIMRHGESAFDFTRLSTTAPGEAQPGGELPMLLMAAEKSVVAIYQRVAELAGLNMVSLEPTLLAMYRVGWMVASEQAGALCLSVDHLRSEVAFIEAGAIRLYRRIEVGSESLFPSLFPGSAQNSANPPRARASILGEEEDPNLSMPGMNSGLPNVSMNMSAARTLALEMRRSIEYYRRENPGSGEGAIVVVSDVPAVEAMLTWLQEELGRPVTLARPAMARGLNGVNVLQAPSMGSARDVDQPELALMPVVGLALGALPEPPAGVPRFNLTNEHRKSALADAAKRALTMSLAAAAAIVLLGVIVSGMVSLRANAVKRELDTVQAEYDTKQRQQQLILDDWQRQQTSLIALQKKGYPFPRLMDAVSSVISPHTGLTEVALNSGGILTITGNAADDEAIVQTLDGLRGVNWFLLPTLQSQERKQARPETPAHIEFKIVSQLYGQPPPATTTGGTP